MTITRLVVANRHDAVAAPAANTQFDINERLEVLFGHPATGLALTNPNADFVLVDSSMLTGNHVIAVGDTTLQSNDTVGGTSALFCAELAGAIGANDLTTVNDVYFEGMSRIEVLNSNTENYGDPLLTTGLIPATNNGLNVYASWQCPNGTADGAVMGAAAAENVQVSFFFVDATNTRQAYVIPAGQNVIVGKRTVEKFLRRPRIRSAARGPIADFIDASATAQKLWTDFTVTADFAALEVFDITTGAGAGTGTSTPVSKNRGAIDTLGASAAVFNADADLEIKIGDHELRRGTEVIWVSPTTCQFFIPLFAANNGDLITMKRLVTQ